MVSLKSESTLFGFLGPGTVLVRVERSDKSIVIASGLLAKQERQNLEQVISCRFPYKKVTSVFMKKTGNTQNYMTFL